MGTITAQILVGNEHQFHGGIIPTHVVYLSENSRPAWILDIVDMFNEETKKKFVRWIPTVENTLEDAMLLIGIHVIKDEQIIKLAKEFCKVDNLNDLEVYEAFSNEDLGTLYNHMRESMIEYSIALTVFNESHIMEQVKILNTYSCKSNIFMIKDIN